MGEHTTIEWCDSTVNPTGFQCCGCELWNKIVKDCYAGKMAERYGGKGAFDKPVQLKPGRMAQAANWSDLRGTDRPDKPWLNGRPRVIFIGDMADTLQAGVPFSYLKTEIIDVVTSEAGRRHVWMWLTKQAKRMVKFQDWLADRGIAWPENLWPGVSVLNDRGTWRVDELVKIHSTHRFISYEPAWEYVDFSRWSDKVALIITGGQSGNKKKPYNVLWCADTIELCEHDHVNCFVKQLGSHPIYDHGSGLSHPCEIALKHSKGGDWNEWPADLRVRQFPEV